MKHLILTLCLSLMLMTVSGCNTFKLGWIREDSRTVENEGESIPNVDGPSRGHFDEEGNWIPDDPTIAATYKIPDISAGFIFDAATLSVSPSLQIELLEFDTHIPYVRTLKIDVGVAYQRAFVYVGKLWTNIFEISTGGFVGWNWEDNELSYGVGLAIIKF